MYVPLLVRTSTYQSGVVYLFVWSLFALSVWGLVLNLAQGTPMVAHQKVKVFL